MMATSRDFARQSLGRMRTMFDENEPFHVGVFLCKSREQKQPRRPPVVATSKIDLDQLQVRLRNRRGDKVHQVRSLGALRVLDRARELYVERRACLVENEFDLANFEALQAVPKQA